MASTAQPLSSTIELAKSFRAVLYCEPTLKW